MVREDWLTDSSLARAIQSFAISSFDLVNHTDCSIPLANLNRPATETFSRQKTTHSNSLANLKTIAGPVKMGLFPSPAREQLPSRLLQQPPRFLISKMPRRLTDALGDG